METLPKLDDIVVHRKSGSRYLITDASLEENHNRDRVWKFKVVEVGTQFDRPYLLQQVDIGEVDSAADYFIQTNVNQESSGESIHQPYENLSEITKVKPQE